MLYFEHMNGPCGPEILRQAAPFIWARITECNLGLGSGSNFRYNQRLLPEDPRIFEGW